MGSLERRAGHESDSVEWELRRSRRIEASHASETEVVVPQDVIPPPEKNPPPSINMPPPEQRKSTINQLTISH
jgi:hypothetical protein